MLALWLPASGFATSLQMLERSMHEGGAQTLHGGHCLGHADGVHDHTGVRHAGESHAHASVAATASKAGTGTDAAAVSHCHDSDADRLSHGQCTYCQVSVSLVSFEPLAPRDVHSSHVLIPRRAVLRLGADTEPPLRPPSALAS